MTAETLYSAAAAAELLGIDRSRVLRIAANRKLGKPPGHGGRIMWLFTETELELMRDRKPGRPATKVLEESK